MYVIYCSMCMRDALLKGMLLKVLTTIVVTMLIHGMLL